jgi:uncharacterized protein (DUF1800 family)
MSIKNGLYGLLIFLLIVNFSGCGSQSNRVTPKTTIEGRVVDAEIKGSTIFLDLNRNGFLDKNEPSTKSDESGKFALEVSKDLANKYDVPLVAVGGYDMRLKQDFNQTLMAFRQKDNNFTAITPLSTLIATDVLNSLNANNKKNVQQKVSSITVEELFVKLQNAQEKIATLFNLDVDLITKDPIEVALSGNLDLLKTNMKVAKVAKEIKKAVKKDLQNAQNEMISSYKALSKALQKAQDEANQGDDVLAGAINYLQDVAPEYFDDSLMQSLQETTKIVLESFDTAWKESENEIISALKDKQKEFSTLQAEEEKIKDAIKQSDKDGDGLPDNLDEFEQNIQESRNNNSNESDLDDSVDNTNSNSNSNTNTNHNNNTNSNGGGNNNSVQLCGIDTNLDDSSYQDNPPNGGKNIPYFTIGTKVSDIEAAFNYARSKDETINKKLVLPSQDIWDSMSKEEQALYILNKERYDRGLKPFEGVEAMNSSFNGNNPTSLADIAQGYANTLWNKTSLLHNLDGTVDERLNRVDSLKNREHIPYNESLYANGNGFKIDDIPLIKAIYNWIYADANVASGEAWGHRAMCLMKVSNDSFGAKGAEGIIAFGLKQGNDYAMYPEFKSSLVVMNAINPPANWNGNYKKATLCKGENKDDDKFIRDINGTIKDTQTALIWQDIDLTASATQDEGQNICNQLSLNGLSWRLPNANELSKFYKDALNVGITPNLAQINSNLMVAKDGWVYTTNGAKKYDKNIGDITDALASSQKGEVRCVSGKEQNKDNQIIGNLEIDNELGVIINKDKNIMWVNNKEYLTKGTQFYGKVMCNNLELGGYKDWRLPKIDELSNFHKKVYENNITIKRNFDKCALEISDKFENNQEYGVVTQAIGSLSNHQVGDEVSIGGGIGIRCVREVNGSTNGDTIPPELNVTYTQNDLNTSTYKDDKDNHNSLIVRINLNKEKGSVLTIPVTLKTEPNTNIYELNGSKIGAPIGKSDAHGNLTLNISDHEKFVAVDENNNISKILEIWVESVKDISRVRAIRFLKQATLGFDSGDVDDLIKNGYKKWLDKYNFRQTRQGYKDAIFSYTKYLYKMMHEIYPDKFPDSVSFDKEPNFPEDYTNVNIYKTLKKHVWWAKIFQGFAPLRLKTAYALSNIIVISADSPAGNLLKWRGEALAYYYDLLYKNAFGNYKDLLRDITYSPAMAYYLTYAGSAEFSETKGTSPDENYARELMQLFTIGINELNLDGTPKLNSNDKFIPTYTQQDVVEAAKVFTGWWFVDEGNDGKYGKLKKNNYTYTKPIVFHEEYHDFSAKEVLGQTISKDLDGSEDIEALLDILYSNQNMAPFISKKLIQEFTTSNPSSEYVARVATVFNDNGEGVKGDLKAVVQAILLDPENLSEDHNGNSNFGKTNDLVTVFAQYLKMFDVKGYNYWSFNDNEMYYKKYGRVWIDTKSAFNQSPFDAPDVFNFYQPTFMPSSSDFRNNNLVAPQLQLYTPNNMILFSNTIYNKIESDVYAKLTLFNDDNYADMDAWMQAEIKGKKKNNGNMFFYLDFTEEYNVMDKAINDGEIKNNFDNLKDKKLTAVKALIDHLDEKLGLTLPSDYKGNLAQSIADNSSGGSGKWTASKIIKNTITTLVTSPYFTTIR